MDQNTDHQPEDAVKAPVPEHGGIGGVMDVKPPEHAEVPSPITTGVPAERSESMPQTPVTSPVPSQHPVVQAAPAATETQPVVPQAEQRTGLSADLLAQAKKEVEKKSPDQMADGHGHKPKKKSNVPIAAIVIAVIVALALSAAAVFAYLKTKDSNGTKPTVVNTTNQPAAATTDDVDTATKDIDEALSGAEAEKDMPASELSEQTLGL